LAERMSMAGCHAISEGQHKRADTDRVVLFCLLRYVPLILHPFSLFQAGGRHAVSNKATTKAVALADASLKKSAPSVVKALSKILDSGKLSPFDTVYN